MLHQLPRLTGSLRGPYDIDQAYLQRKIILQNHKSQRFGSSNNDLDLARDIVHRWEEASTDVRLAYKEFLGAVVELCNGEVLSEEFQEVAKTSYNLLTGFGTDFDGSRRIIETKEKRYDIQTENLESKYKDWQKKLHPDLVHSKSEKEKAYTAEQSARVIDAYRTLRKPLLMAMYLMRLEGEPVDEEQTVLDPELLAEFQPIGSTRVSFQRTAAGEVAFGHP